MVSHLEQWWATHLTWIAAVVAFLTPSVTHWVATHPASAVTVGALWGIIQGLLPSPVVQAPPKP